MAKKSFIDPTTGKAVHHNDRSNSAVKVRNARVKTEQDAAYRAWLGVPEYAKHGVQFTEEFAAQEREAGRRTRIQDQALRQDTGCIMYEKVDKDTGKVFTGYRTTPYNIRNEELHNKEWAGEEEARKAWAARDRTAQGFDVIEQEPSGQWFSRKDGVKIYPSKILINVRQCCPRFMNFVMASGRPVAIATPFRNDSGMRRRLKGGTQRTSFPRCLSNAISTPFAEGYRETLPAVGKERMKETGEFKNSRKVDTTMPVKTQGEVLAFFRSRKA